ncbi:MAG: VCBS repeat-containing protein [Phycisphaerales bacterium]|nr:MAG: VCBS repeat-containing protein [Phycisphaerales bacterium]
MKSALPAVFLVVSLAAPCALAGEAKIITVTDEVSAVPGAAVVKDYHGPLPALGAGERDIPQMPGFPTAMGADGTFSPMRGLVFADITGDGYLEIVTSSTDRKIYAWDYTGTAVPGFPVSTIERAQYAPSVADMDGDNDLEIVQFTRGLTSGGRMYILDHTGQILPGFPKSFNNNNITSCPTLYDLDDDGMLEVIVPERAYPIALLHIVEIDGTEWGGNWPVALDHVPTCTAAVGDVNNDGAVEIFYMSYNSMYLLAVDGTILPGWPRQIPNANFSYQSAALADLDGDDDLEIVVGAHKDAAGCYVFHHDGTSYPGWPKYVGTWTYCPPTVTDLEGDGVLEILDGRAGYGPGVPSNCFWAWDSTGAVKPGFPYHNPGGGGSEGPLTVADINGDGLMEIFADHNIMQNEQGYLFGVDAHGNDLPGFPLRPRGFTYMNGATIGDVDGDGDYELGVLSTLDLVVSVNLYDLSDIYAATCRDWKVYHAQNNRGGLYPTCPPCPADVDGSGVVDIDDVFQVLSAWGPCDDCPEDIDDSGVVDIDDIFAVLADWGPC